MLLTETGAIAHAPEYCMPNQVKSFWEHYKEDVILFKDPNKTTKSQPVDGNTIMSRLNVTGKAVGDIKHLFEVWYLENPSLTKEDLIQKYINWASGFEIWIAREKGGPMAYVVSYNEPTIEKYIASLPFDSISIRYLPDVYKENIKLEPGEKIKVKVYDYPGLKLALDNQRKAQNILRKIGKELETLDATGDFKEIELSYDCHGDLST